MPSSLTPGSSDIACVQLRDADAAFAEIRAARHSQHSRNPFHARPVFRGFTGSPLLRPVRLLAPLDGSDRVSPATGGFYIQASGGSVTLPAAGYDYNSNWTPLLAGLSPAGMAASLAAPDPSGPNSGTRLPPWVSDGEAFTRPGVKDVRSGEPGIGHLRHPRPCEPVFLAAPPQRAPPQVDHMVAEGHEGTAVRWHRMISKVAVDHLRQPAPLDGDRLMHAPPQHVLDPPLELEGAPAGPPADVGEPQEAERLRFAEPAPRRDRPQMWVNPRKQNVSGLPSPRWARRSAAKRPNAIRRVLSGCNVSANSSKRARIASRKRWASASCSKPTTSRVAEGTCTPPPSQNRT